MSVAFSAVKFVGGQKRPFRRAAAKKLELWSPFGKRFVVPGFLASDGAVVKDPVGHGEAPTAGLFTGFCLQAHGQEGCG
jgi:hypothetical protein